MSIERGSDKHGARVDDELEHETRGLVQGDGTTHAEELYDPEPLGEDQAAEPRTGGVPDGMTAEDVDLRSRIGAVLGKEVWPATGEQLVAVARSRQATDDVVAQLSYLAPARSYENLQQAWVDLQGGVEQHRS